MPHTPGRKKLATKDEASFSNALRGSTAFALHRGRRGRLRSSSMVMAEVTNGKPSDNLTMPLRRCRWNQRTHPHC